MPDVADAIVPSTRTAHDSGRAISIPLDRIIVPPRGRPACAELIATVFGVLWAAPGVGPFFPVNLNEGLTLDFDHADKSFPAQHYCFRMSESENDRILARFTARGIPYRSTPHGPVDVQTMTRVSHRGRGIADARSGVLRREAGAHPPGARHGGLIATMVYWRRIGNP